MNTLKNKEMNGTPDSELLAISGSLKQYHIDIDNFVKRAALVFEKKKRRRKAKPAIAKKSAKAKKG